MTRDEIASAARLDGITIPMPGEFFAAIARQGRVNWTPLVRTGTPPTASNRAQIALTLGTLVADGYIAVEAQDSQAVKNIGREILALAKKLNANDSVLGRGKSLTDFAENNDWNALREELEATQNEVKLTLAEQKDTSLITLVTVGAWLRGTQVASGIVETTYSPETARLLRQPAIIEYLISEIDGLPSGLRADPLVTDLRALLEKSLVQVTEKTPTSDNVKALHEAMTAAIQDITQGGSES